MVSNYIKKIIIILNIGNDPKVMCIVTAVSHILSFFQLFMDIIAFDAISDCIKMVVSS